MPYEQVYMNIYPHILLALVGGAKKRRIFIKPHHHIHEITTPSFCLDGDFLLHSPSHFSPSMNVSSTAYAGSVTSASCAIYTITWYTTSLANNKPEDLIYCTTQLVN